MSLKKTWNEQYDGKTFSALKDKNLFDLEVNAIILAIKEKLKTSNLENNVIKILELGCGTGELIKKIDNSLSSLEHLKLSLEFIGIDFSENAISQAKREASIQKNFKCLDFQSYVDSLNNNSIDIVITQRSIMALMDRDLQNKILLNINRILKTNGLGIFSECFESGLITINQLRSKFNLDPIKKIWHSLYLEENQLFKIFNNVEFDDFCSTYFLVTRVFYPYFQTPQHNQKIHDIAAVMPNFGKNSFLKLALVSKKTI
jgi:ubiquinone/menaquinone biosynthesis C-methylase UbiE